MEAKELLERYKSGQCTPAEQAIVESWYLGFEQEASDKLSDNQLETAVDRIWARLPVHEKEVPQRRRLWPRIAVAAAVLATLSVGFYFFQKTAPKADLQVATAAKTIIPDVMPGGNKATLILADGKEITLDDAGNGKLAEQSGIVITKTKDGELVYTVSGKSAASDQGALAMNMISTPKGGFYQINLPDGTRVWLNAASSLRYPTVFTGGVRQVSLTGEAYFEVAKVTPAMPFKVITTAQTVEVLGTHFNINSYTDEPGTKTTLLEGAVKVSSTTAAQNGVVLKPGQQATLQNSSLNVAFVNTDEAVAWKNGMFRFNDADLQTVMRSVSRWYDVEISYEGKSSDRRQFSGEIHRNIKLSEVLDILSFFKVHFRLEGRKLIVTQ